MHLNSAFLQLTAHSNVTPVLTMCKGTAPWQHHSHLPYFSGRPYFTRFLSSQPSFLPCNTLMLPPTTLFSYPSQILLNKNSFKLSQKAKTSFQQLIQFLGKASNTTKIFKNNLKTGHFAIVFCHLCLAWKNAWPQPQHATLTWKELSVEQNKSIKTS